MAQGDRSSGLRPEVTGAPGQSASATGLSLGVAWLAIGILTCALASRISYTSLGDNHDPGPRAFPLALGVCLAIGGIAEIYSTVRHQRRQAGAGRFVGEEGRNRFLSHKPNRDTLLFLAALLVYIPAISVIGFSLATISFSFLIMMRLGAGTRMALLLSGVMVLVIHLLFVRLFKVQLPPGLLGLPF